MHRDGFVRRTAWTMLTWLGKSVPTPVLRQLLLADSNRESLMPTVKEIFATELIRNTNNFGDVTWCGTPVWQNVLDLWTIQETLASIRPSLLIECGTNRGGSALFYAQIFDLLDHGEVVTIDVEKMHSLTHPRVSFVIGSSVDANIVAQIVRLAKNTSGPVMVILDSDHTEAHVARELECYAPLVTPGSFVLVQDGVIDVSPIFRGSRPGPLPATVAFLANHPEFEVDRGRTDRFLITHHPMGWLKRVG